MTLERLHIAIQNLWRLSTGPEKYVHCSSAFRALEDTCRSVYLGLEGSRLQRAPSGTFPSNLLSRVLHNFFRWNGAPWPGLGASYPPIVGDITNDIIYSRITDGLLYQLRLRNPKNQDSERKCRHHQWLSDDFGVQELREHLVGVTVIMRTVDDSNPVHAWAEFMLRLDRACPRKRNRLPLKHG